jgi:hypothetical protein
MSRKLIAIEPATLRALDILGHDEGKSFQELIDESLGDLLKKHKRPITTSEMFKQSLGRGGRKPAQLKPRKTKAS